MITSLGIASLGLLGLPRAPLQLTSIEVIDLVNEVLALDVTASVADAQDTVAHASVVSDDVGVILIAGAVSTDIIDINTDCPEG